MFKKSPKTKQFDMFSSPSGLLCEREGRLYDDPSAWHNTFYRDVTSNIDEEIFKPLYATEKDDNHVGRPNVPIRILVAMIILKEGIGCSDEQLYEHCRFNLLYRRALGMVSLDEQCPTIDSYYGFPRKLCKHEEKFKEDLFDKCFKQITKQQAKEYRISGKSIRMDSKLISSNIAWYSHYEIIQKSFVSAVTKEELERISDQLIRQQALAFFVEDAAKTVYRTDSETMGKRLLTLGIVIVKGFVTNITETVPEDGKPSLITDVKVKGATAADNDFFEEAVKETEKVTGNDVENAYVDGAYQSEKNREFAKDKINIISGVCRESLHVLT